MPLSYFEVNGRPFDVVAMASANQEEKLRAGMSALEKTFPNARRPPDLEPTLGLLWIALVAERVQVVVDIVKESKLIVRF